MQGLSLISRLFPKKMDCHICCSPIYCWLFTLVVRQLFCHAYLQWISWLKVGVYINVTKEHLYRVKPKIQQAQYLVPESSQSWFVSERVKKQEKEYSSIHNFMNQREGFGFRSSWCFLFIFLFFLYLSKSVIVKVLLLHVISWFKLNILWITVFEYNT